MKNIFKSRKGLIAITAISFISGVYHLYLLGRCDEISEILSIAGENGSTGFDFDIFGDKKHAIVTIK